MIPHRRVDTIKSQTFIYVGRIPSVWHDSATISFRFLFAEWSVTDFYVPKFRTETTQKGKYCLVWLMASEISFLISGFSAFSAMKHLFGIAMWSLSMSRWVGSREQQGKWAGKRRAHRHILQGLFLPPGATSADFLLCLIALHIIKECINRPSHSLCQSHMDSKTLTEV